MVEYDLASSSSYEEVCVAELVQGKPYECPALTKPKDKSDPGHRRIRTKAWPRFKGVLIRHYENG